MEIREDRFTGRVVVISPTRSRRPHDAAPREQAPGAGCVFCPGNEAMTPPAVLMLARDGNRLLKLRDEDGARFSGWGTRVFPNLFPALSPEAEPWSRDTGLARASGGYGFHEIAVDSRSHGVDLAEMEPSDVELMLLTHMERVKALSEARGVVHVSLFKNHGAQAGASQTHAHSQVVAAPFTPPIVEKELASFKGFKEERGGCILCRILGETSEERLIARDGGWQVFTPIAPIHQYEFWIAPGSHQHSILEMGGDEVKSLSGLLKRAFTGLGEAAGQPPYNMVVHLPPKGAELFHWHFEVYPRMGLLAGFELGGGAYINTVPPEAAAEALRNSLPEHA